WSLSSGPSQLELVVLDWFKQWIGYPSDAAGVLTSGGSAANMTALACARESVVGAMSDRLVVYCADHAHSSVARAARILGFRPDRGAQRARPRCVARPRTRRLHHARSAQVALSAVRVRLPPRAAGRSAAERLRDRARLPARREDRCAARGELRGLRHAALADVACDQGVAVGAVLRARRVPRGDRSLHRSRAARRGAHPPKRSARAAESCLARDRVLSPA